MPTKLFYLNLVRQSKKLFVSAVSRGVFVAYPAIAFFFLSPLPVDAQQNDLKDAPVVVQPGAPGEATRKLPSTLKAKLPPISRKDIEFMQGMIHHHAQAVEMIALMKSRTDNQELLKLGTRISRSQADEIEFMKRWLETRGERPAMKMETSGHHHQHEQMLMPGMLTAKQMDALRKAAGAEFDRLFLAGMIQHHRGALVMVEDLFKTAGAGQDAELFSFATDVDGSQRAEIRIMQTILGENP